jgi:Transposase DNA-binding/Transposase DDE domain
MGLSKKAVRRVGEVFRRADLGDARLVERAVGLAEAIASSPKESLPKIWSSPSALLAGYRFLRNPSSDFTCLMEPQQHATREQALTAGSVLVLHDTTDIVCPAAEPEEVGFLQTGRAGFYVHHAFCVDAATQRPLGMLWSQLWGRPKRSSGRKLSGPQLAKLEERESDRWLESVTEAALWSEGCEQVVHVMDREADFFRLFEHMHDIGADFVVRLRHDRKIEDSFLTEELVGAPVKMRRLISIGARQSKSMPRHTHAGRTAREVQLSISAVEVELQPPRYMPDSLPIRVHVVQAVETQPPAGAKPISWVIATSLPVRTKADLARVIDTYRARWLIEEFHKALKTGCMFEKRQLESFQSITTLLAICYPVACELLELRFRSRDKNAKASDFLRPSLLDCLRAHPKARALPADPTLEQALAVVAGLGGHIKYNGPPGWQTLASGYMELLAFERGWLAALSLQNL